MNTKENPRLTPNAQKLRREMTKEEKHLWYDFLKDLPLPAKRQKIIGRYIVDFYIPQASVVIELDGSQHGEDEQAAADRIRDQYMILKEELNAGTINFTYPDTNHSVTIDESDLSIVLFNLLQNSIYWLSTVNKERHIKVDVYDDKEGLSITVSDNGPGIKPGTENSIYDPYFSTKPDGIGLGLAIVGEIMAEYNGELSLISTGENNGATFNLLFRKRV